MTRLTLFTAAVAAAVVTNGCDECAGTPSCRVEPELSYSGQVVVHGTGKVVPGTQVSFVRDSGVLLQADSIAVVTDGDGFFTLRVRARRAGDVFGHLRIAAPAPYRSYVAQLGLLQTTTTRGDGTFLGRFSAEPYMLMIGILRDRKTGAPMPDVTVKIRRNSGGRFTVDSATFVTDFGGQFAWYPVVAEPGDVNTTFEITAPGYPRTYNITRDVRLLYLEGDVAFQNLPVGMGFPYYATSIRRGFGRPVAGTTVEFTRLGGIATVAEQVTIPINENGTFGIPLEPQEPGSLFVQLRIIPPTPLLPETRELRLATSDDDQGQFLGYMGVGAQVYFGAQLRFADNNEPLPEGTFVLIRHTSGPPLLWDPPPPPQGDWRLLKRDGRLEYGAPTPAPGDVTFDIEVQLPAPLAWDTIAGVSIPSRYNDTIVERGVLAVRRRVRP